MKMGVEPKAVWIFYFYFLRQGKNIASLLVILPIVIYLYFVLTTALDSSSPSNTTSYIPSSSLVIICFIALSQIFTFILAKKSRDTFSYELTDTHLQIEYWFLKKGTIAIEYNKIINVEIYQGMFGKMLGLATVIPYTEPHQAIFVSIGFVSIGRPGSIIGLSPQVAEQVRAELLKRISGITPAI